MKNTNFLIDGALAPKDADRALGLLREWMEDGHGSRLDVAPVPPSPGLPSQIAIQLLIAAERELAQDGKKGDVLSRDARQVCAMTATGQYRSAPTPPLSTRVHDEHHRPDH